MLLTGDGHRGDRSTLDELGSAFPLKELDIQVHGVKMPGESNVVSPIDQH